MKKLKSSISGLVLAGLVIIFINLKLGAQQTALFNTYSYDLMQLNIATIGRTCVEANLNYRAQWLGVKESPRLYQLNAGMALGANNGIGIKVFQQSLGLLKVTNATGGYAFRVKLNETSKLHLGLGASWSQNNFEGNRATTIDKNDPTLGTNQNQFRSNNFDCEAGALFLGDKLTAGLSAEHIYNTNSKFDVVAYKIKPQLNLVAAYKFNKGKSVEVEPWLVNRYTLGGINQPEVMVNVKLIQKFVVAAGYRVNYGLLGMAGFELGKFRIAYSFDYGTGKTAAGLGSSHQILLGIDLCKKKVKPESDTLIAETVTSPPPPPPLPTVTPEPVKEEPKKEEEVNAAPVKEEPLKEEPVKQAEPIKQTEPVAAKEPAKIEPKKEELPPVVREEINPIATLIVFDKNSSIITTEHNKQLLEVAKHIKTHSGDVTIVGYASPEGTQEHNLDLAIHRAEAVRQVLVRLGIKASRLKIKNGGPTNELNPTIEGNRTVRFE